MMETSGLGGVGMKILWILKRQRGPNPKESKIEKHRLAIILERERIERDDHQLDTGRLVGTSCILKSAKLI